MLKNKDFPCFQLSDVVFTVLINVKMPTLVFNIYEHDKFDTQLSIKMRVL